MSDLAGAPILGAKPRATTGLMSMVRHLDADGQFEAEGVRMGPDGSMVPVMRRDQFMDAGELLDAIRQIVREELAAVERVSNLIK